MKGLLKLQGFCPKEALQILKLAKKLKASRGKIDKSLKGKTWAMIFSKSSTRTRVSFEVGIRELGGFATFLSSDHIQLGRGEPIIDTARVLGRMTHGAVIRTFSQKDVEDFALYSGLPTINALTDDEHPCQILSDVFTYQEKHGSIQGKRVAFIGDGASNVANSLAYAAELFDYQFVCAAPDRYQTQIRNAHTSLARDPIEAAQGADILYTDVWVSMGKENESEERCKAFDGYQINAQTLSQAKPECLVMHCLPAYRGKEITDEIMELKSQDIFDQAENRLHVQKAIMKWLSSSE